MQACMHQPKGYEHVILRKLFGHMCSQRKTRIMADEEVEVSGTSAQSSPITVHGVVVGQVSPLKSSKTTDV